MAKLPCAYAQELLAEHSREKHPDFDPDCIECARGLRNLGLARRAYDIWQEPIPERNPMKDLVIDTEFNRVDLSPHGLISIALVTEDASYYAVNWDLDINMPGLDGESVEWMRANVWKHLPGGQPDRFDRSHPDVKPYHVIRQEVDLFLRAACPTLNAKTDIELFANCGAQDVVRLHTLLADNDFSKFGDWVPQGADDMYRLKRAAYRLGLPKGDLPVQDPQKAHHALWDAEYELDVIDYIRRRLGGL